MADPMMTLEEQVRLGLEKRKERLAQMEQERNNLIQTNVGDLQRTDLAPVMGLVDSLTGSKLAQSYTAPTVVQEQVGQANRLQNAISNEYAGTLANDLAMYQQKQREAENAKDRELREQLQNALMGSRENIASLKATAKAQAPQKLSGDMWKAGTFANRLDLAEADLDRAAANGNLTSYEASAMRKAPEGSKPEWLKQAEQAERNFVTALLRRESGAAISPEEFATARMQYLPQWGDTTAVLAQKKKNRELVKAALAQESGDAYNRIKSNFNPTAAQPVIEDGYRFLGGDKSDPKNWEKIK